MQQLKWISDVFKIIRVYEPSEQLFIVWIIASEAAMQCFVTPLTRNNLLLEKRH